MASLFIDALFAPMEADFGDDIGSNHDQGMAFLSTRSGVTLMCPRGPLNDAFPTRIETKSRFVSQRLPNRGNLALIDRSGTGAKVFFARVQPLDRVLQFK